MQDSTFYGPIITDRTTGWSAGIENQTVRLKLRLGDRMESAEGQTRRKSTIISTLFQRCFAFLPEDRHSRTVRNPSSTRDAQALSTQS